MTDEQLSREEERERAEKALETAQMQLVQPRRLGKEMDRIKRVNGIAAALGRRLGAR